MSKVTSVVLYFTAGILPTAVEVAEIARLSTVMENVRVRNGAVAAETLFSGKIEACDFVAGKAIPATYTDAPASKTVLAIPSDANPDQFKVFPAAITIDASNLDVQQLAAIKAEINAATGFAAMTNLSADATVTYASSDTNKATVSATGLVTAVAAGATNITATLTAGTPVTAGAIEADDDVYTKAAHGFLTGEALKLVSLTGGTGLTAGTTYYFIKTGTNTGKFATTYANAVAGTAINVTLDATNVVLVKAPVTSVCAVTVAA